MKTLKITEDTWWELTVLKVINRDKSYDKTISWLIELEKRDPSKNENKK